MIDTALVGHAHAWWLAPLALGTTLVSTLTWMLNFLMHASTQSLASVGDESADQVGVIQTSLLFALILGVLTGLLIWFGRDLFYHWLAVDQQLRHDLDSYLIMRVIGHPFALLAITSLSLLRGVRGLKSNLVLVMAACLVNAGLSATFLWKTDWGLWGVGLATTLSQALIFFLATFWLFTRLKLAPALLFTRLRLEFAWSFGQKSWHLLGRSVALASCFFMATRVASTLGPEALATHQVALQFWLMVAYVVDGLAMTSTILIAEARATSDRASFDRVSRGMQQICWVLGALVMILYSFGRESLWVLFTREAFVWQGLAELWWVIALGQIYLPVAYIYDGLLFGAGAFREVKRLMWLAVGLGFLPFAWLAVDRGELIWLWAGLSGVGVIRTLGGLYVVKKIREA